MMVGVFEFDAIRDDARRAVRGGAARGHRGDVRVHARRRRAARTGGPSRRDPRGADARARGAPPARAALAAARPRRREPGRAAPARGGRARPARRAARRRPADVARARGAARRARGRHVRVEVLTGRRETADVRVGAPGGRPHRHERVPSLRRAAAVSWAPARRSTAPSSRWTPRGATPSTRGSSTRPAWPAPARGPPSCRISTSMMAESFNVTLVTLVIFAGALAVGRRLQHGAHRALRAGPRAREPARAGLHARRGRGDAVWGAGGVRRARRPRRIRRSGPRSAG